MANIDIKSDQALKYFEEKFKIKIQNKDIFLEALTHSSFINENKK
jgi:dsRNA-specific ribonuclease